MTTYRIPVRLPGHVHTWLAPFIGQGAMTVADESTMIFEVEAANLWDLAENTQEIRREADASSHQYGEQTSFGKPREVAERIVQPRENVEVNVESIVHILVTNLLAIRGREFAAGTATDPARRAAEEAKAIMAIMAQFDAGKP